MKVLYSVLVTFFLLKYSENAKILATVFSPAYSHQTAFRPLWKELLKRGHEITLLTTDPMNETNLPGIREIDLSKSYDVMEQFGASDIVANGQSSGKSVKELFDAYIKALSETAKWQLGHPEVKALIQNKSEYFDLIMTEVMFPAHLGFVDRFRVPFIGITSLDSPPRIHDAIGNFIHPVVYPDYILPFSKNLTFPQRLISTIVSWFLSIYEYYMYQTEYETARRYFGDYVRPLKEIEKDMSMLFINVNPLFHHIRPTGPNTIQIGGGTHIKEAQPLPQDLKNFLDNSEEGVIYFSLGTTVKGSLITDQLRSVILETFAELPYKVLWKFEKEHLSEVPKNVKIIKWVPQQDLLRHPKIVLFITQCGLQSMEESIYSGVPMVGMPFFGDQMSNAKILEDKSFGLTVDKFTVNKETLRRTVLEVINNPIYREQTKKVAELMTDVEMTGLEKAVWWTEYTIRTDGAKHLRSLKIDLPFYKLYLLDVIGFLLIFFAISFVVILKACHFIKNIVCSKKINNKQHRE